MPGQKSQTHDLSSGRERIGLALQKPWSGIARMADTHTRAVQAWLSTRAPGADRLDGVGITAASTGLGVRLLNLALGYEYPAEISDPVIETEIENVKAFFARRGAPWSWWISAQSVRSDFDQRLKRHGLTFNGPLPAMAAALPVALPELDPNICIRQVATHADLQAASVIRRAAFRFPDGAALTYFEDMADDWLEPERSAAWLYLAAVADGPPASLGALIVREGVAGVYVMATLPKWGRRGLGKAILAHILDKAMQQGHRLIALTASRFGFPLYRQFGFEHIYDYAIYVPGEE